MKGAIILALLLFSMALLADGVQPDGAGTAADPYQIATLDNLLWLSTTPESWESHFIQTADIDASDTQNWNDGEGFMPIGRCFGDEAEPFCGSYNGQSQEIAHLYICRPDVNDQALFGLAFNSCMIRNLDLTDVQIQGAECVGAFVANSWGRALDIDNCCCSGDLSGLKYIGGIVGVNSCYAQISNCNNQCEILGEQGFIGGLIGWNFCGCIVNCSNAGGVQGGSATWGHIGGLVGDLAQEGRIEDCSNTGNVYSNGANAGGLAGSSIGAIVNCWSSGSVHGDLVYIGGLVGSMQGSMTSCTCTATVEALGDCAGGLAGRSRGNISDCQFEGSVEGVNKVGGLVGLSQFYVADCANLGSVAGADYVGGIVGYQETNGVAVNSYNVGAVEGSNHVGGAIGFVFDSTVDCCYNAGLVQGDASIGGLVAVADSASTIDNSFWDVETSGCMASAGGTGKTTAEMHDVATYTSLATVGLDAPWDFVGDPYDDTGVNDYWAIDPTINDGYPYLNNEPVSSDDEAIPSPASAIALSPAFPNPFNPTTTIAFSIAVGERATLEIFNVRGQRVRSFGEYPAGEHSVVWNGRADSGASVASGVYFYRLYNGRDSQTRKMLLMK